MLLFTKIGRNTHSEAGGTHSQDARSLEYTSQGICIADLSSILEKCDFLSP